jgi:hypothetical protein
MMDNNYLINVIALSESFIENKKDELKDVSIFVIRKKLKDGKEIDISIDRETIVSAMVEIFSNGVTDCSSIEIYYEKDNKLNYLNGISIF